MKLDFRLRYSMLAFHAALILHIDSILTVFLIRDLIMAVFSGAFRLILESPFISLLNPDPVSSSRITSLLPGVEMLSSSISISSEIF